MSTISPDSTPELELHPAIYADPPPTPPPSRIISTPKRLRSGGPIGGRVSSPFIESAPPPPTSRELFSEALAHIRAYEPERARRVLDRIEDPTSSMATKVQEAKEVLDAMLKARHEIALAHQVGDWRKVLKVMLSFETTMYFRSNGSPRRAYRFPMPRTWLYIACEAFAFLGRVEEAERTLNQLVIIGELSRVDQSWLMALIAYVSGNVRTCLFHLQSDPTSMTSNKSGPLLERAKDIQNALDSLEALDFTTEGAAPKFQRIALQIMDDDKYELLDCRLRKYIFNLYFQKEDAAKSCGTTAEKRPLASAARPQAETAEPLSSRWKIKRGCSWGRRAASLRLKRIPSARSLFNNPFTGPRPRAASTSAITRLRDRILRPSVASVEQSFREMEKLD